MEGILWKSCWGGRWVGWLVVGKHSTALESASFRRWWFYREDKWLRLLQVLRLSEAPLALSSPLRRTRAHKWAHAHSLSLPRRWGSCMASAGTCYVFIGRAGLSRFFITLVDLFYRYELYEKMGLGSHAFICTVFLRHTPISKPESEALETP